MPGLTGGDVGPLSVGPGVLVGLVSEDNTCPGRRLVRSRRLCAMLLTLMDLETRECVRDSALWAWPMNCLVSVVVFGRWLGLNISRVSSLRMSNLFKLTLNMILDHASVA